MEYPADESVVKKISLNKPEQTTTEEDSDAPETPNDASTQIVDFRFVMPFLWKFFKAKIINFIQSILIKFVLAFFIYIIFVIDLAEFNAILLQGDFNMDYSLLIELTIKLLVLEDLLLTFVFFYKIFWLHGSRLFQDMGTIGKTLLGLTLVWLISYIIYEVSQMNFLL